MGEYRSKYYFDDVDVLKNKFEIKNYNELEIAERKISGANIIELQKKPLGGKFDFKHLCNIHKSIFEDIYDWAGKLRVEEIYKGGSFAPSFNLGQALETQIFQPLKEEKYLKGYDINKLSSKLAYYMCELNFAHPFREGNGRTQRQFIKELAMKNGYNLDWDKADPQKLLNATIKATRNFQYGDLENVIKDSIINKEPDKQLIKLFDKGKDFDR